MNTVKAYSSVDNMNARWPKKNFNDVTNTALRNTHKEDDFTHLVVSAPSVDITNLDTSKLKAEDNTEYYKQEVAISCKNMFNVAHDAIRNHPNLEKVIVMEHPERYENRNIDPA